MVASPMEFYALDVINQMRADPPAFADVLDDMRRNRTATGHGFSNTDPVWQDLRTAIASSLTPSNVSAAIDLLRATEPLPPLAWEDSLYLESDHHNTWMQTTCFAHSTAENGSASSCLGQMPGLTYNPSRAASTPDYIGKSTLGEWSSGAFNENIGYQSGPTMPQTRAEYAVGSDAHRQRQAYYDVVNFVLEFNSSSLGHLEALLHTKRDAIGVAYELLDGFSPSSSDTNFLATHTLSRNSNIGGYLVGIAYDDANENSGYDIGEETSGCVSVESVDGQFADEFCSGTGGLLSSFLSVGDYWIDGGVSRQLMQLEYQTENQNIDVSGLLAQQSVFETGYVPIKSSTVDGTFDLEAGAGYQTLMIQADTNASLMIEAGDSLGQSIWVTQPDRTDVGQRNGNTLTASLVAGEHYIIVASSGPTLRQFEIAVNGGVSVVQTNLYDRLDVDGSGEATPLDALAIINQLARQSGFVPPTSGRYFYDANADGLLSPRDALSVINAIALRQASASQSAEGEFAYRRVSEQAASKSLSFAATTNSAAMTNEDVDQWMTSLGQLF
ncbi:hypothetical protein C2E31_02455 [Rhodopirellula baltica]|nr:hypothetical protein C2E31_02455 [Rhodopirellula baltica]